MIDITKKESYSVCNTLRGAVYHARNAKQNTAPTSKQEVLSHPQGQLGSGKRREKVPTCVYQPRYTKQLILPKRRR